MREETLQRAIKLIDQALAALGLPAWGDAEHKQQVRMTHRSKEELS